MKMNLGLVVPAFLLFSVGLAHAQESTTIFYGGLGSASGDEWESDAMPFAIGFLHQRATSSLMFGADIGGEGTMLDSTWGGDELRQALSFNLILGTKVAQADTFRVDAGVLLGLRESFADCLDSGLGYQCYANTPPITEYDINFGGIVGVSFNSVMFGVRATGESTQLLVGFRF